MACTPQCISRVVLYIPLVYESTIVTSEKRQAASNANQQYKFLSNFFALIYYRLFHPNFFLLCPIFLSIDQNFGSFWTSLPAVRFNS